MTTTTLEHALKNKKPAIIKEKGVPRYVVLDEDTTRLAEALADKKNQKHTSLSHVKKMLNLA